MTRSQAFKPVLSVQLPKYHYALNIIKAKKDCPHTLYLNYINHSLIQVDREIVKSNTQNGVYIGVNDLFFVIHSTGEITSEHIKNIEIRDVINDRTVGEYRDVIGVIPLELYEKNRVVFIAYMSTDLPNTICIRPSTLLDDSNLTDLTSLSLGMNGRTEILSIFTEYQNILTIDKDFRKSNTTKYVYLTKDNTILDGLEFSEAFELEFSKLKKHKVCMNMLIDPQGV
jgi:hypothetical protein